MAVRGSRDVYNRNSTAGQGAGIDCGCELRRSQHDGKKCERDEPQRCKSLMNSKSKKDVDESEMRVTPGKKICSK